MDVRFYPAPPANVGTCSLPTDPGCLSSLDYYHPNKVNYNNNNKTVCCSLSHQLLSVKPSRSVPAAQTQALDMFLRTARTYCKHSAETKMSSVDKLSVLEQYGLLIISSKTRQRISAIKLRKLDCYIRNLFLNASGAFQLFFSSKNEACL